MSDSSHDKPCLRAGLAPPRTACLNRDFSSRPARATQAVARRVWVERAGACAPRTPVWLSRDGWLAALGEWAHSPAFTTARTSARVSITAPTLLVIAAVMAEHADHATGRHVAVTRATIAARAGCSPDTITVAWRLLRVTGWAVEAQRGHGSPGTPASGRRPSVYHLISRREPRSRSVVHNPDLPPKAGICLLSSVGKYSPSARKARAAGNPFKKRQPYRAAPRPLPVQRLADELVGNEHGRRGKCHGLHRGHLGAVCDAIMAAGIDPAAWSAQAITDALDADMKARGWSWPDRIDRPGAFLSSRLRRLDWRPAGPPKSGGGAAASPEEKTPKQAPKVQPLTPAQQARIATARAQIDAILNARAAIQEVATDVGHRAPSGRESRSGRRGRNRRIQPTMPLLFLVDSAPF